MPPSWNDYQKKLLHTTELFLVDEILQHLCIEEDARILQKKELAPGPKVNYVDEKKNYSNGQGSKKRKFSGQNAVSTKNKKKNWICYNCGKKGHYKKKCDQNKK